jgi:hypothetical protein
MAAWLISTRFRMLTEVVKWRVTWQMYTYVPPRHGTIKCGSLIWRKYRYLRRSPRAHWRICLILARAQISWPGSSPAVAFLAIHLQPLPLPLRCGNCDALSDMLVLKNKFCHLYCVHICQCCAGPTGAVIIIIVIIKDAWPSLNCAPFSEMLP